ncbi:MAG: Rhomboid protease AarA [candidate division WS2 bacterium]|uniref:Rhomboid protease AarA n=1 Tax=Psychracetigena formicireducens TaxID=2986056 RepID=A0A9E2F2T6_PSYF1|nr:Rhomboid protease AarA [Candidatus Psychracetigena formicireducens]
MLIFVLPEVLGSAEFLKSLFALHNIQSEYFYPWQWITYMFIHSDFMHLLFNMLGLLVFGALVENTLGGNRFALFYIASGVGAGLLYSFINYFEIYGQLQALEAYIANPNPNAFSLYLKEYFPSIYSQADGLIESYKMNPKNPETISATVDVLQNLYKTLLNRPMVGASGAVYAVMAAIAIFYPNIQFFLLLPPIPVKAKYLVGFYAALSFYNVVFPQTGSNIAHLAHLGGLVFGAVFALGIKKQLR